MTFRFGELFCGAGGIALGAQAASREFVSADLSIKHVWSTDQNVDACATYALNFFPNSPDCVISENIKNDSLFCRLLDRSPIDALAFGFPCNDFSTVGERKGANGHFGPLYSYGVAALEYFNPRWFFAENVRGLHLANNAQVFREILQELEQAGLGYNLVPHLYKFEKYGVPQARHRIIIIGIRKDQNVTFRVPSSRPFENIDVSSRRALTVPPIAMDAANHELTRQSPRVVERLRFTAPGENAFTAELPEHLRLNIKGATLSQIYKRLDPDKPAYTVTGSGGGGTHVYHWEENRALTNRERARLQTFPDDFEFMGSKESVRRQIGMAVPPLGAKVIFEAVLKTFAGIDYESETANIILPQTLPISQVARDFL